MREPIDLDSERLCAVQAAGRQYRLSNANAVAQAHAARAAHVVLSRCVERRIHLPVGTAGREALQRYDERELATILDFLRTARRVQEEPAARIAR